MKKFFFTLAALAALSTVSLANNRGYDLRDSDTYFGKYSTQLQGNATSAVSSAALAVSGDAGTMTSFERMKEISIENDRGRH